MPIASIRNCLTGVNCGFGYSELGSFRKSYKGKNSSYRQEIRKGILTKGTMFVAQTMCGLLLSKACSSQSQNKHTFFATNQGLLFGFRVLCAS